MAQTLRPEPIPLGTPQTPGTTPTPTPPTPTPSHRKPKPPWITVHASYATIDGKQQIHISFSTSEDRAVNVNSFNILPLPDGTFQFNGDVAQAPHDVIFGLASIMQFLAAGGARDELWS